MSFSILNTRAMQFLVAVSIVVHVANADIIGVDISEGNSGQTPRHEGEDIVTSPAILDPVLRLNRYTFENTILKEHADEVAANWIVLFCPPWYEPCQALEPIFRQLGDKWQGLLNSALLSTEVRFAAVDCATEKALCNSQNVIQYPFVAHYRHREQVKVWRGKSFETDQQRLSAWLQKELGSKATALSSSSGLETEQESVPEDPQKIPMDFLLIFAAIAGNAWFISRGSSGSEASSPAACVKQMNEGVASHARSGADQSSSCIERSSTKEGGLEI